MIEYLKKHFSVLTTVLITIGLLIYIYGCPSQTKSLTLPDKLVNRQELQLEFDQLIGLAQLRMLDLDQQDAFKSIILQNALILVQGQPFNPLGLITAAAAVYGISQGGSNISKVVKNTVKKKRVNNG